MTSNGFTSFLPLLGVFVLSSVVAATSPGCQSKQDCELSELALQGQTRVPAGTTHYLPGLAGCDTEWMLVEAPAANTNVVVVGEDAFTRFTPVEPGTYRFEAGEARYELDVVGEAPFEHFNYYPTSSLAEVGSELWVADVFDPHISRIDPASGEVLGTIQTGPWPVALAWRPGMDHAVVAHKAGDTLGLVELETNTLVDAVWVGDEPSDLVVSPDGTRAYASLSSEGAVAVIDLEARALIARIETNSSPGALALTEDGETLLVASFRSATSERYDGSVDERNDLYDIAVIETAELEVSDYIERVGSNINGLLIEGNRVYVATTRMDPTELTIDTNNTAFKHTVASYDLSSLDEITSVDIGRQASATDFAVRPFGLARLGERLWVVCEGSDLAVALDPETLAELSRIELSGRPRSLIAHEGQLYIHGAQSYAVLVTDGDTAPTTIELGADPRPPGVAAGQYLYTGRGAESGDNHGCGECHVDALTDGNLWNAGVFSYLAASRPMFWLEGSHPIGWEADGADLYSYLFGSPAPTIGLTIDNEDHAAFYDYLAALVPPPAPTGKTERDGSMTEQALRGREVFDSVGCSGCHSGSLTTNRIRYPSGTQPEPTDVPSLVGSYRHGFWLVDGSARTLAEAVEAMLPLSGSPSLDDEQFADLVRYVDELSAREFFLLGSTPEAGDQAIASSEAIELVFSHPVFEDADNLARVSLVDADGQALTASVEADGRHITVTPDVPLDHGASYTLVLEPEFESFAERRLGVETRVNLGVAAAPGLALEGDYVMTILRPGLDFENERYDFEVIIPIETPLTATPTDYGATFVAQLSDQLSADYEVVVEGEVSHWPALIMATSPKLLGKTFPTDATLVDEDDDGIADSASGTLFFRSPGLEAEGVEWTLSRPGQVSEDCETSDGTHAIDVQFDDLGQPIVDWSVDLDALGYYVTDPDAIPPVGPGTVTGGESYWVVQTESFPTGFRGPINYGEVPAGGVDGSEANGAPLGGAELPSSGCIKLTVQFADFSTSTLSYTP